jgi:hypothetical protein
MKKKAKAEVPPTDAVMKPDLDVLVALGSLAVHIEEFLAPGGHQFDKVAMEQCLNNPKVKAWLQGMDKLAFLPKKRSERQ